MVMNTIRSRVAYAKANGSKTERIVRKHCFHKQRSSDPFPFSIHEYLCASLANSPLTIAIPCLERNFFERSRIHDRFPLCCGFNECLQVPKERTPTTITALAHVADQNATTRARGSGGTSVGEASRSSGLPTRMGSPASANKNGISTLPLQVFPEDV
jgi:hypothetical protein